AHLLFGPRRAGLVVEDGVAAVAAKLDPIGAAAQRERAVAERNLDLAVGLGGERSGNRAAIGLPPRAPVRAAPKYRPPKRAGLRKIFQSCKARLTKRNQRADRVGWRLLDVGLGKFGDGGMNDAAALGGARFGIDGIERAQPQHMFSVDRIWIAQPILDLRDRQA